MRLRVSVDSGGTFTDGIATDPNGSTVTAKAHTTPADLTVGTVECLSRLAGRMDLTFSEFLAATGTVVHGTTLATNIVATRGGARLGTITTKGFRDRLFFLQVPKSSLQGDLKKPQSDIFDFRHPWPRPLVARRLATEVNERVDHRGNVLVPLDADDVRRAVAFLAEQHVEAIAVLFLHAHVNPSHELRAGEIARQVCPGAYVVLSHEVAPIAGEVGRWSTATFSAYVGPRVTDYVERLEKRLAADGFGGQVAYMQSNGGVATAEVVRENPATLLFSGPAAGPAMGAVLGRQVRRENVLTVDMGGTSFDVAVIPEGRVAVTPTRVIDGQKFSLPTVDVSTIGTGGGSIAWIDSAHRLQVGPESAGASPGPACYGLGGTLPTVTDANVVLGYIDPEYFLGGEERLDVGRAAAAIAQNVAEPLGLSVEAAAAAIYEVANAQMAGAITLVFTRRGYDPRDFLLCCGGGAGPVHGARLMQDLGAQQLLIPRVAPVFCAYGMLHADLRHTFMRPYAEESGLVEPARLEEFYGAMRAEAETTLAREGVAPGEMLIEAALDMRYYGQIRELTVDFPFGKATTEAFLAAQSLFHERHRAIIGYSNEGYPTEVVRLYLSGTAKVEAPRLDGLVSNREHPARPLKDRRQAYFREASGFAETDVYDGGQLAPGWMVEGPCIVEEAMTTVVVPVGTGISVDELGNYLVSAKE